MAKSVFIVYVDSPDSSSVVSGLEANYEGFLRHSDHLFFLESDEVSAQIKEKLGIGDKEGYAEPPTGIVLRTSPFTVSGFTKRSLWEWLYDTEAASR